MKSTKSIAVFYVFLSVLWLVTGCSSVATSVETDPRPSVTTISVDPDLSTGNSYSLERCISVREVLYLENSEQAFWRGPGQLYMYQDTLVVVDPPTNAIMVFDQSGQVVQRLEKIGKGPGEYLNVADVVLSRSGVLSIYSSQAQKVLRYDLSGNFLSEQSVPFFGFQFAPIGSNRWAFLTRFNEHELSGKYNILITDSSFNVLEQHLPYEGSPITVNFAGFIVAEGDSLWMQAPFSDTMWVYGGKEMTPAIYLDYQGKHIKPEEYANMPAFISGADSHVFTRSNFMVSPSYLIFEYSWQGQAYFGCWDREKEILIQSSQFSDPELAYRFFRNIRHIGGDTFALVVDARLTDYPSFYSLGQHLGLSSEALSDASGKQPIVLFQLGFD